MDIAVYEKLIDTGKNAIQKSGIVRMPKINEGICAIQVVLNG